MKNKCSKEKFQELKLQYHQKAPQIITKTCVFGIKASSASQNAKNQSSRIPKDRITSSSEESVHQRLNSKCAKVTKKIKKSKKKSD